MLRPTLEDLCSIVCFKSAIIGMEDALGEKATAIALTRAGRLRGKHLAEELDLVGSKLSFNELTSIIGLALGKEGTRLCIVEQIIQDGNVIKVYTKETLCSADEPEGSQRKCTYTLGAVWGVLEQTLDKRLQGKHTEFVLRGSTHDVFEFTEMN